MKKRIDYAALGLQVVADECRRSFFYFVKTFWATIIQEAPVYNWHIPFLCDELQAMASYLKDRKPKPYDLIINIPPGTTKSTIVTIMYPAWLWIIDPTLQIITNSYSGGLSIEHAMKSKDIITSDRFRMLFPEIVIRHDKSGKQHYANTHGGFRYATSTSATITGYHAHVIINDDPVNPKQASSDLMRASANEHMKTLASRKVNKANTPMITVMQRLHVDDVTGYQLKKKGEKIRHICLPAELSPEVKPASLAQFYVNGLLDPVRLNKSVLDEAKIDLGSIQYAGQYGQAPVVDGGNIIKRDWFRTISLSDFKALRFTEPMHFFVDTAYAEKKAHTDNDPTGILSACRIGNNIYLYDAQKVFKEMPELLRFIPEYLFAHEYANDSMLHIEPKANGESVVQMFERLSTINVTRTVSPTDNKVVRAKAVSPRIECGRVYIVEGSWNEEFLTEVTTFPNAPHDEYVDILGYAINYFFDEYDDTDYSGWTKESLGLR